jgi:hypothetical protein
MELNNEKLKVENIKYSHTEAYKKAQRKYRDKNADTLKKNQKLYYLKNKEKVRLRQKNLYLKNKGVLENSKKKEKMIIAKDELSEIKNLIIQMASKTDITNDMNELSERILKYNKYIC